MVRRINKLWLTSAAIGILSVAAISMVAVSLGQVMIRGGGRNIIISPEAVPENGGGVYVRDSGIAMEKLELARRMERARQWEKSADIYQEILEKYPDRVVPAGEDPATHVPNHYTSVTETVRESLSKWPLDGLEVYRSRYETPAAQLVAAAGTDGLSKLHEVLSRYFPTDSAKVAGIRLMDIYFEQGDYAAAHEIGQELLEWHPNLVAGRPMVLYRTALAAKLADQPAEADRWLGELRRQFPQATGTIRGQDILLASSLAKELAGASIVRGEGSDSWLTVGGDASRGKICQSTVKPGARLYTIPLMRFNWAQLGDSVNRAQMQSTDEDQRKRGAGLGIMPVVDQGELFFQDNTHVYALDLDSGVPLPAWMDTYPASNGSYAAPGNPPPVPLGKQLCVSVNDKYLTAVMDFSDPITSQAQNAPAQDSRLVCLDRKTGKNLWTFSPQDFPESQMSLRELRMGGAPLMVGDNVYVMVHGQRGQFDDCYVACFSLQNGAFRWATFIANAGAGSGLGPFADDSILFADAISHIAYAGGRLFVVSNIGAAAALDAYSGTIDWLNVYRTDNSASSQTVLNPMLMRGMPAQQAMETPMLSTSVPWIYNPAIVQNGKLFALPSDGRALFIYDTGNGSLIKQIPLADSNLQESRDANGAFVPDVPTTLLGVNGDMVYLAGSRQVWQVPWTKVSADKNPDEISGYWRSADSLDPALQVRGRAFVTADAVYLPTQSCLRRILLSTGTLDSINSKFPKTDWEEGKEGPGNVIVTQDHVIVAGDTQVAVYTDIALAKAKLDREIADSPSDPQARLHYAEVMFAAAETDVAQDRLEEAFQLLGGVQALRTGPARERAFNDALSFARRSAQKDPTSQQIDRFFDLAQAAALSPNQQVSYRMARADFDWSRATRDAAGAVELYQEILGNPEFRRMPMGDPKTGNPTQAGVLADKAIARIMETPDGQQAYAAFEQAAAQKLAAAKAAGNPDALLEVANVFPDSRVVSEAMMSAADLYEGRGNPRMATQVLRKLLARVSDRDKPVVLESMCRNYLKMPGHLDVAVGRLQSAASLAPRQFVRQPLVLPNGAVLQGMSLASARDDVMRYEAAASVEALPDLHLPTHDQTYTYRKARGQWAKPFQPPSPGARIDGVDEMVVPLTSFTRNDRIVAWSAANGLAIYPIAQNKPLFTDAAFNQMPAGAAWTDHGLLVWSYGLVTLINDKSGMQKWTVDMTALPAIVNAGADNDNAAQGGLEEIAQVAPAGDRVVITTTTGRLLAIDSAAGRVAWQIRSGGQTETLLATDDFTVIRYQDGQTVQLEVYDTASGQQLGKKSFAMDTGNFPINLALAADGTLVYTLPNQLCIQDLFNVNQTAQSMEPSHMSDPGRTPTQPFFGSGQPGVDQLLIHSGRIFALANSGKDVRVFSLETGDLWAYSQPNSRSASPEVFPTDSTSPNVRLRVSGNYLFLFSPRNLRAYRIDPPTSKWDSYSDPTRPTNFQQLLFGADYLALVDRPSQPLSESNHAGNKVLLSFFNRFTKTLPNEESGLLLFTTEMPVLDNNATLQAVDGGIAYFTGHSIQTYLGARDTLAN